MTKVSTVRTRFAPSPTGYLHIGSLRTALFCYLFAKQNKGDFILRIEDTDRQRLVPDAVQKIIAILNDFGLSPDEGPGIKNGHGPYIQSERLHIYAKYAERLVKSGQAYYEDGEQGRAIKFKLDKNGKTTYADAVYGEIEFKNENLKDPVILKSDGYPVYNFANVIDDHLMEVSHVFRGEEFLSSTPIHVQLYQAFDWRPPVFVHLPLILDEHRKKLSKRTGDVAVEEYLNKGYLKPALLNFIALLGWNPKTTDEIFSLDDLIKQFSIPKLNKSGAVFDVKKLDFLDKQWRLKLRLPLAKDPLFARSETLLNIKNKSDKKLLEIIWQQILERASGPSDLGEILEEFKFYFECPNYPAELLRWKDTEQAKTEVGLNFAKNLSMEIAAKYKKGSTREEIEKSTKDLIKREGLSVGEVLWPLRVALSGSDKSPSPFEIIETFVVSGREQEISIRLHRALEKIAKI